MRSSTSFPLSLSCRLREERSELVSRWLARIAARVNLESGCLYPVEEGSEELSVLIAGIADYVGDPAAEFSANSQLLHIASNLGSIRHSQGFELHEILKEYEILGGVLFAFAGRIAEEDPVRYSSSDVLSCSHRLFRAISVAQQVTSGTFGRLAAAATATEEERLRSFSRGIAHEVRNRLGALRGAVELMDESFVLRDELNRRRFVKMAGENIDAIERTTRNLIELSRVEAEPGSPRNVLLKDAIFEVTRQLRLFAEDRAVSVFTASEVPVVEVPASAVELALANYVSNAIKYCDPAKEDRVVQIRAWLESGDGDNCQAAVAVVDNGIGVPAEARDHLFTPFFRVGGESAVAIEGTGLGLSLVRETIEGAGGRVWAELDRRGETVFALAVPCREVPGQAG